MFINWINKVLHLNHDPQGDILPLLRSGELLCQLITTLYGVKCHLLGKPDYCAVHKIVFFLEVLIFFNVN